MVTMCRNVKITVSVCVCFLISDRFIDCDCIFKKTKQKTNKVVFRVHGSSPRVHKMHQKSCLFGVSLPTSGLECVLPSLSSHCADLSAYRWYSERTFSNCKGKNVPSLGKACHVGMGSDKILLIPVPPLILLIDRFFSDFLTDSCVETVGLHRFSVSTTEFLL